MANDSGKITLGTKGPNDDFFCHKYHIWYRVEDCVYRNKNRTFNGCVNCFQGRLNVRSVEKGIQPPVCLTADEIPAALEAPRVVTNRPRT